MADALLSRVSISPSSGGIDTRRLARSCFFRGAIHVKVTVVIPPAGRVTLCGAPPIPCEGSKITVNDSDCVPSFATRAVTVALLPGVTELGADTDITATSRVVVGGMGVGVAVNVGVAVGVGVGVAVGSDPGAAGVGVSVGVDVAVAVGVRVGVAVGSTGGGAELKRSERLSRPPVTVRVLSDDVAFTFRRIAVRTWSAVAAGYADA